LPEIKYPIVVGLIGAPGRIVDPDGIVTESLPNAFARADRHEVDGEVGRGGGEAGRRGRLLGFSYPTHDAHQER
jgi:hypothetical protein